MKESLERDSFIIMNQYEDNTKYYKSVTPPVFMTSLHTFSRIESYLNLEGFDKNEYIYGRTANPTAEILERKLAELERGNRAYTFASGQAAFTAAVNAVCEEGSHIICMANVYGCVKAYLDQLAPALQRLEVTYVSGADLAEVENSIRSNTRLMILESPSTFKFSVVDIAGICNLARRYGIKTYIDNSCATPIFQKPLCMGCDMVMHTMSKYIGGHSDLIGGVLIVRDEALAEKIRVYRELAGGILGPMEAWLALRGLRTLVIRVSQHQETALQVADFLEGHNKISAVYYTGLRSHPDYALIQKQQSGHTGLMSFYLDTEKEETIFKFFRKLNIFRIGCSWGGFESLALMPLYHCREDELELMGLKRYLIRIHCGLEGTDNLITALEAALKAI